ncbi:Cadherin-18 Cadherin-14 Precursor [Channa argus]|uniref:Cadherin-18 Cadherin-14 n=1 Tax=Channa argus TaxID=215402 RepID=A0A6G1QMW2_CHAAH|nr:Cadherin-18 Cadherin-14 Precursor [Channa argus]
MDREAREHYIVVIQAKDMAGQVGGLSGSTTINITLTDVNDNPPKFPQKNYQLYVPESAQVGKPVGKIKANDEDLGVNADIKYSIINSEGANMFSISTDRDTREGIISLKKPLNYERKKTYTLHIEGVNTHVDPRFSYLGSFKDTATLKITVGDVDEAPVFSMDYYIMDVYENAPGGTEVGAVTAQDPDSRNSPVRYFLDSDEHGERYFRIDESSGVIRTTQPLDREDMPWHNITVMASEVDNPSLLSHVPVTVQILDVNDNPPEIATEEEVIVCESSRPGQDSEMGVQDLEILWRAPCAERCLPEFCVLFVDPMSVVLRKHPDVITVIQTITAVDKDDFANGQRFFFALPSQLPVNPNFTLKDNEGNVTEHELSQHGLSIDRATVWMPRGCRWPVLAATLLNECTALHPPATRGGYSTASIIARRRRFNHLTQELYELPIVVWDGGEPSLSGTSTLTLRVCPCQRHGRIRMCQGEAFLSSAGLSTGALIAILLCIVILLGDKYRTNVSSEMASAAANGYWSTGLMLPVAISSVLSNSYATAGFRQVCERHVCSSEENDKMRGTTSCMQRSNRASCSEAAIVVLFITLRQNKKEPLIISEEDIRENVVTYDDEGGGEEDTEAFDIIALRNPAAAEELKFRRDIRPEVRQHSGPSRSCRSPSVELDEVDVHEFIKQRLVEADMDTSVPPYDSLQTYAYEGQCSPTGSISPLDSPGTRSEQDYHYLDDWGPEFQKLADLYGEALSDVTT